MTAIKEMIDALFDDPVIGNDAVYKPESGTEKGIRVIEKRPESISDFDQSKLKAKTALFDVRVNEVEVFAKTGDKIVFKGVTYVVQGAVYSDDERYVWRIDTYPAGC